MEKSFIFREPIAASPFCLQDASLYFSKDSVGAAVMFLETNVRTFVKNSIHSSNTGHFDLEGDPDVHFIPKGERQGDCFSCERPPLHTHKNWKLGGLSINSRSGARPEKKKTSPRITFKE